MKIEIKEAIKTGKMDFLDYLNMETRFNPEKYGVETKKDKKLVKEFIQALNIRKGYSFAAEMNRVSKNHYSTIGGVVKR